MSTAFTSDNFRHVSAIVGPIVEQYEEHIRVLREENDRLRAKLTMLEGDITPLLPN